MEGMNRQEIIDRLRENERALRERGVTHAALFGSRARGDNRPDSDTDIMIGVDPDSGGDWTLTEMRCAGAAPYDRSLHSAVARIAALARKPDRVRPWASA